MSDNHRLPTERETLPSRFVSRSLREVLSQRLTLSDALSLVARLLEAFPNGRADLSGGYMGALAAILCSYPREIAMRCADPVQGVARETRFLPTVADLVGWCERELKELRRPLDAAERQAAIDQQTLDGRRRDEELEQARKLRPTIDQLKEKWGKNWGLDEADEERRKAIEIQRQRCAEATRILFERECKAFGADPSNGISPSLVRIMLEKLENRRITDDELRAYFAVKTKAAA